MSKDNRPLRTFLAGLAILLILFSVSCSPARKAIKAPIKEEGADYLFKKLKEHELKYTWFSGKFSASYKNQKKAIPSTGRSG